MKWSIKIATLFGIPVKVHVSFLILIALIGMSSSGPSGVFFVALVFGCVLLHELGHSLVARKYHVEVDNITLLPIGGVAAMRTLPKTSKAEFLITIAGPAVSCTLAVIFTLLASWYYSTNALPAIARYHSNLPLIGELARINFYLTVFNLIPAFPMDGGRIFRSIIWSKKDFYKATDIAVNLSQGLAIGFFLASFVTGFNLWLTFIAIFIYFGAQTEGRAVAWRESISDAHVGDVMQKQLHSILKNDTLQHAVNLMISTHQEHFPVLDGKELIGILTKPTILKAIRQKKGQSLASEIMTRQLHYCSPLDSLTSIIEVMDNLNLPCVLVQHENKVVGLITPQQIWQYQEMRRRINNDSK